MTDATLSQLVLRARVLRKKHQDLVARWLNTDVEGPTYKVGAPLDELERLDREANLAAAKAHKQLDAVIRGKVSS